VNVHLPEVLRSTYLTHGLHRLFIIRVLVGGRAVVDDPRVS
jgi:hypothetical protein